jgi:hypothetical protein
MNLTLLTGLPRRIERLCALTAEAIMQDLRVLKTAQDLAKLETVELKALWTGLWHKAPPPKIGRKTLIVSIQYKQHENAGLGLTADQQRHLETLVKQYKRNPNCFDGPTLDFLPGTRLVRIWKGKRYEVIVKERGFEYGGKLYSSLSDIASQLTGTRWNGWVFFGLKKKAKV